ncbi:MAG: LysM peptidoglycan-binding domain-containing protein, partial [Rhodobacteraceae bacterium]|nr:LysM peptidoglycan-binding domain-containing protein [Paracoccaceae bacterium]
VEVAEAADSTEAPAVEVAEAAGSTDAPAVEVAEAADSAPLGDVAQSEARADKAEVDVAQDEMADQQVAVVEAAPVDPLVSTSTGQQIFAPDVQVTSPVLVAVPDVPQAEQMPQALATLKDPEVDPVVVAKVQNPEAEPRAAPEPEIDVAEVSDSMAKPAALAETAPEVAASTTVLLSDKTGVRVLQAPSAPGIAPQVLTSVALDAITYDDTGDVALSGRGSGRSAGFVRVYLDNKPITTSRIRADGSWKADLPEVDTGVYTLRVDQVDDTGDVTSRVESPFKRESREALAEVRDDERRSPIKAVTVQPGDTLWAISRERYGDGILYVRVFQANRDRIRDPDLIYPGQIFALPKDEIAQVDE